MHQPPKTGKMVLVSVMGDSEVKKGTYDKAFIRRVRIARESSGLSREEVAKVLGIKTDTYARYELKVMMPHHHIPEFAKLVGVSLDYLFGHSEKAKKSHLHSV